jgi:hypothetical protein
VKKQDRVLGFLKKYPIFAVEQFERIAAEHMAGEIDNGYTGIEYVQIRMRFYQTEPISSSDYLANLKQVTVGVTEEAPNFLSPIDWWS